MVIKEELIFLDDNDNEIDKDNATKFILRRKDENDNLISENFGRIEEISNEILEESVKDNILYVTRDEYEYLKEIDSKTGNKMNFDEIKIRE